MAGVHAVGGGGSHEVLNYSDAGDGTTDKASDDLMTKLGPMVDEEGNITPSGVMGDTHGGQLGQQGEAGGEQLNVHKVISNAKAMGMTDQSIAQFFSDFTGNEDNFNPNQPDAKKHAGAVLALNELTVAETLNHTGLDDTELREVAGEAATIAKGEGSAEERGAKVREVLEDVGGNLGNLTNTQLADAWAANSHDNNHAILNVDSGIFKLTHQRSVGLNGESGGSVEGKDVAFTEEGISGAGLAYSNDKRQAVEKVNGTVGGAIALANGAINEFNLFPA
jgi:hypothetical protein